MRSCCMNLRSRVFPENHENALNEPNAVNESTNVWKMVDLAEKSRRQGIVAEAH